MDFLALFSIILIIIGLLVKRYREEKKGKSRGQTAAASRTRSVKHPNTVHYQRRRAEKQRGQAQPQETAKPTNPWVVGAGLVAICTILVFIAAYAGLIHISLAPNTAPEPDPPIVVAPDPEPEPVQVTAQECASGTYEGVCADHLGSTLFVFLGGNVTAMEVKDGGTDSFYPTMGMQKYDSLVLAPYLYRGLSEMIEKGTITGTFNRTDGEVSLLGVLEDTHRELGVIVSEARKVRDRRLPSMGDNQARFTIQGQDATWTDVTRMALYLFAEHGPGRDVSRFRVIPPTLSFDNPGLDGWRLQGAVARKLGVRTYDVLVPDYAVGADGCRRVLRGRFQGMFHKLAPPTADSMQQYVNGLFEVAGEGIPCGSPNGSSSRLASASLDDALSIPGQFM